MTLTVPARRVGAGRRWWMLGASTVAQAATAVMVHGPAFLIPALHRDGMSLAAAGAVAAAPTVGEVWTGLDCRRFSGRSRGYDQGTSDPGRHPCPPPPSSSS